MTVTIEELTWAARHTDWRVREAVARHPRAATPLMRVLVRDPRVRVWTEAIHNPGLSPAVVAAILVHGSYAHQVELARRESLEEWAMGALAVGWCEGAAVQLARRKDLPRSVKVALAIRPGAREELIKRSFVLDPEVEEALSAESLNHGLLLTRCSAPLRWSTLRLIALGDDPGLASRAAKEILARAGEFAPKLHLADLTPLFMSGTRGVREAALCLAGKVPP